MILLVKKGEVVGRRDFIRLTAMAGCAAAMLCAGSHVGVRFIIR